MTSAAEAAGARKEIAADIAAGQETLSLNQEVTFKLYCRIVLPIDGFTFWVRSDLLARPALLASMTASGREMFQSQQLRAEMTVKGSLHYGTQQQQNEDASFAVNQVVFTSETEVQDFNEVSGDMLYIGDIDGVRFAFSSRGSFYRQTRTFHYVGNAIYSTMLSQIIDDVADFSTRQVVSNSLPIWLSFNGYTPPAALNWGKPDITLYPSYLVDNNIKPPFGAVHIVPESTTALQAAPYLGPTGSHDQLTREIVRITFYGLRNDDVMSFMDFVNQYSLNTDNIGLMNSPVPRDDKLVQSELGVIAMKKTIEFEVNYWQTVARDLGRQLILRCLPTYITAGVSAQATYVAEPILDYYVTEGDDDDTA